MSTVLGLTPNKKGSARHAFPERKKILVQILMLLSNCSSTDPTDYSPADKEQDDHHKNGSLAALPYAGLSTNKISVKFFFLIPCLWPYLYLRFYT